MDGPHGEEHVILGARIMGWLFGPEWADECYCHSRYWAQRMGLPVSRLCLADKLAFATSPAWLYIPMTTWTGELAEYMERSKERQAGDRSFTEEELILINSSRPHEWFTRASELHIAVGRAAACGIYEDSDRSSHSGKAHAASNFVIRPQTFSSRASSAPGGRPRDRSVNRGRCRRS
jgi:hypothetical protein